LDYLKTTPHIL